MSEPIYEDPVIAEIHAIRAQMLAECDGDHHKLMEKVREHERASGRRVIPAPPATMPAATSEPPIVILEPPKPGQPPPRIHSPRLAHPEQGADFVKSVYREGDDA